MSWVTELHNFLVKYHNIIIDYLFNSMMMIDDSLILKTNL